MLVVQRQLQNAADAGALSGAEAFGSNSPNSQAAQTAATTAATAIVTGNYWGNQQYLTYCTVTPGYWSNVNKGFTGTTSTTATLPTQTPPAVWAIQVVVPKSSSNNGGPLQLIFGPILGIETVNLNGTAVAMVKSPSVTWSVLETGSSSITLNSNVTINGGSVGDNGSSLTLDNGVTVPQGQVYINTATSVTNNSGLTPVQNSASNTLLSQAISSANAAYTNFIGLSNNTGTYSNAGQSANLSITGTNTVNVVDISNLLLDNPYNITLNGTSAMSFVVRVSGTFTLNSNTSVLLSGGLTAGNVTFIATGGSVIIDGGTMNGSILTQNSSVTLNSSATLNGSIVSGQSIMLDHGVTTPSTTFMSSSSGSALVQ